MAQFKIICGGLVLILIGCTSPLVAIQQTESSKAVTNPQESIGVATMDANRTLFLQLRAESEDGAVGDALLTYKKEDAGYAEVLKHIGAIQPGETVSVKPWSNNP